MKVSSSKNNFQFSDNEYGFITLSADQTTDITAGDPIKFNTLNAGNVTFNPATYRVTLKKNRTYTLKASILAHFSGNTGVISTKFYNVTTSAYVGTVGYALAVTHSANNSSSVPAIWTTTPIVDTIVELRFLTQTALAGVYSSFSSWEIQQLNIVSPVIQPELFPSQMVTGSSTLQTLSRMATLNVNSATATITIPEGYSIGQRLLIRKIHATQGAVEIVRSGSEVFTRASLTSVELNANGDYWLLEKVTSTRWELVEGHETGSNANGDYKRFPDGQMNAWFRGSKTISAPNAYGSIYQGGTVVNYPITFIGSGPAVHIGRTIWSSGAPWSTVRGDGTSSFTYNLFDISARAARSEVISWSALGRWYA